MAEPASTVKAHCNTCGGARNHTVLFRKVRVRERELYEHYCVTWADTYSLLECQGCEEVKLRHESVFSEHTDESGKPVVTTLCYPPSTFRQEPPWLSKLDQDWHLMKLMREIYSAMQNSCPSLVAMGIRAAFEAIMVNMITDQGSFMRNLATFADAGFISKPQGNAIKSAIDLGHASIHRMHIPEPDQLEHALDVLENLIHGLYILSPVAERNAKALPPRRRE